MFYLRTAMKKILLILLFLFLLLLNMQVKIEDEKVLSPDETTFICNKKLPLQDELKNFDLNQYHNTAYCPTSRIQVLSTRCERPFKVTTKFLEFFLLKEQNTLNRISESYLTTQSIKFSTLRMRSAHWVYVLRKIII